MAERRYGQFCGLAKALELVGERWALLVVRDLLLGPKRFTDLRRGLPRIPTNILATRLRELEEHGIVERRMRRRAVVYELTGYGAELEDVVLRLGRWGAASLGRPGPDDIVTEDSLVLALRATFQPAAARTAQYRYQLVVGPVTVHARVEHGTLTAAAGPLPDADLTIETQAAFKALLAGEIGPTEALRNGSVRVTGDRRLLTRFTEYFRLRARPLST